MTNYLEAAAKILDEVADRGSFDYMLRAANGFAMLAAIDKGLLPKEMAEELYGQVRADRSSR